MNEMPYLDTADNSTTQNKSHPAPMEILQQYIALLWQMFQYDIQVFSQPWMYYALLLPAFFYFIFFMLKWTVLTTPFWLPLSLIAGAFNVKKG